MTRGRTLRGDLYKISPAFDNVLVARSLPRKADTSTASELPLVRGTGSGAGA
jgi:hypothetical protein